MEINKNLLDKYFKPVETPKDGSENINSYMCSECKGKCCKYMGCHISPDDLKDLSKDGIFKMINELGFISIDWWEGNPNKESDHSMGNGYYLRIRNTGAPVVDPSFGGVRCMLLTDAGCPIEYKYRPKGARELLPCFGGCIVNYNKQQCAKDWWPYRKILHELYEEFWIEGQENYPIEELLGLRL